MGGRQRRDEVLAHRDRHRAARGLEIAARLVAQRHRFQHMGLGRAARVQRHVERDRGRQALPDAGKGTGLAAGLEAARVVARGLDRGRVALPCLQRLGLGGVQCELRLLDLRADGRRVGQPFEHRRHLQRGHARAVQASRDESGHRTASKFLQHQLAHLQVELRAHELRRHGIGLGLRFANVRNRGRAGLEAVLRRGELLRSRGLLDLQEAHVVARLQHLEAGLDELLLRIRARLLQRAARLVDLRVGRLVGVVQRVVEQRLLDLDAVGARVEFAHAAAGVRIDVELVRVARARGAPGAVDRRAEAGFRLRQALLGRPDLGLGRRDRRIDGDGVADEFGERLGVQQSRREQQREEQFSHGDAFERRLVRSGKAVRTRFASE